MFSLPSWPARTTHLRWSTELSRNTTWRISAVRISASARLSNVAKVVWAQRKFTHKYWPVFFFFAPIYSHVYFHFIPLHQSSRSRIKPTCFTLCVPPPTMTLCSVSDGEATGDVLAPLPALEMQPRPALPSEKCLSVPNMWMSSSSASAGQKTKWSSATDAGDRTASADNRPLQEDRGAEKSKLVKELWNLCRHIVLYCYKQQQDWSATFSHDHFLHKRTCFIVETWNFALLIIAPGKLKSTSDFAAVV